MENDSISTTNSGSIKLSWHSQAHGTETAYSEFELQRATTRDFSDAHAYYKGPDLATYVSGLANGSYFWRIREIHDDRPISAWSEPVEVVVEHHSLSLAFMLFGIGGLVFILTLIVVLKGAYGTGDLTTTQTTKQTQTVND